MIIFPAVDIMGGKCVRLRQGKPEAVKVYNDDPVEQALKWQAEGAQFLHVVDLDGALSGELKNLAVVEKIVKAVALPVQLGGGVRDLKSLARVIDIGVKRVVIGTALIKEPSYVIEACGKFGPNIVAAVDGSRGKVVISGWQEQTELEIWKLAQKLKEWGVTRLMYTDISTDGTLVGPNISGIRELAQKIDLPLIASGGVAKLQDIKALKELEPLGVEGVIIGTALYEKKFTLEEAIETAR